jgi:hypothetical protein
MLQMLLVWYSWFSCCRHFGAEFVTDAGVGNACKYTLCGSKRDFGVNFQAAPCKHLKATAPAGSGGGVATACDRFPGEGTQPALISRIASATTSRVTFPPPYSLSLGSSIQYSLSNALLVVHAPATVPHCIALHHSRPSSTTSAHLYDRNNHGSQHCTCPAC